MKLPNLRTLINFTVLICTNVVFWRFFAWTRSPATQATRYGAIGVSKYALLDIQNALSWHPNNCLFLAYSSGQAKSTQLCLSQIKASHSKDKVTIAVMGDSRMRQIAYEVMRVMIGSEDLLQTTQNGSFPIHCDAPTPRSSSNWLTKQCNLTRYIPNLGLEVQRWWVPHVTSRLARFHLTRMLDADSKDRPDILLINAGAWLLLNCKYKQLSMDNCTNRYRRILSEMLPLLSRLGDVTRVVWVPQNPILNRTADHLINPVHNPTLDLMNSIARDKLAGTNVHYWSSYLDIFNMYHDSPDGLHLGMRSRYQSVQVLLNFLCNEAVSTG